MGAAQLDADTLGRYVVAQAQYTAVTVLIQTALAEQDGPALEGASKLQDTYFRQARACANDLGMTITSRCRLVIPDGARKPEENPFEKLMRERMARA